LLTERRLSDVFASSRAREAAFFCDSNKVSELVNLHRKQSARGCGLSTWVGLMPELYAHLDPMPFEADSVQSA
jgi:hypothetical protein